MSEQLGMRHVRTKKVKRIDNSDRSLILRQQFAIKFFELLDQGYRVLNADETWISDACYVRKKWVEKHQSATLEEKTVAPNITLIGAVDTEGDVYISLIQANTDAEVFKLYLSKLAMQLDRDRPGWREKTILMLDSAKYHTSGEVT